MSEQEAPAEDVAAVDVHDTYREPITQDDNVLRSGENVLRQSPCVGGAVRDEQGRWVPGHRVPGGGLVAAQMSVDRAAHYIDLMTATLTDAAWCEIVAKAVSQARQGHAQARTWLAHYLIGKPIERIEADISMRAQSLSALLIGVREQLSASSEEDESDST